MTTITIERAILDRLIDAWDSTVLPKSRDGMMQERMEDLRAALAAPATAPDELGQLRKDAERKPMTDAQAYAIAGAVFPYSQHAKCLELIRDAEAFHGIKGTPATAPEKCGHCGRRTIDPPWPVRTAPTTDDRHALQAAGTHPAPCARHCEAKAFELEIRGRKADTVRADQALLAQDITLQNMAERHAQELCAYSVTVDKLRAERKPMTDDETLALFDRVKVRMLFTDAEAAPFASGVAAAEHFHGIGEKP